MALKSLFPVFVTAKLVDARNFSVQHLGFHVVFEADWYVQLQGSRADGLPAVELAFMHPDVADQPADLHAAHTGSGVILTIEDEPWRQHHFLFRNPTGTLVDVVQQIPPAPGFAAAYSAREESEL